MIQNYVTALFSVRRSEFLKVALLFLNFFFIVGSYYVFKPIRGSLVIQKLGADALPYVWTFSVFSLIIFVSIYGRLVDRASRPIVVTLTSVFFMLSLFGLSSFLHIESAILTGAFYIWGDIFSVVMVEQFWAFSNDIFKPKEAKRLYGVIGSGGILGSIFGSALVKWTLPYVGTMNMPYVCMGVILVVIASFWAIEKLIHKRENIDWSSEHDHGLRASEPSTLEKYFDGFKLIAQSKYLFMIALILVITQMISTVIDFKFNKIVEVTYGSLEAKTAFFSSFYFVMGWVSFFIMLFVATPVHRFLGVMAGLLALPLVNFLGIALFLLFPIPFIMFGVKLLDKGLNYSINRASKEQLYILTSRAAKYKAKAVIDMLGYRASKVLASAMIIPCLGMLGSHLLSYLVMGLVIVLFVSLHIVYNERKALKLAQKSAQRLDDVASRSLQVG